jgi:guanylate kinase
MPSLGTLYVISAPSGAGKTTLVKELVDTLPSITVSISHTTRAKRPAETHGINYYFVGLDEFNQMVKKKDFLEHATVFENFYGTSRAWVEQTLARGIDVILEIDWQGCQQIQKIFPECVSIFILPPSLKSLEQRLRVRNQDHEITIKKRLEDSKEAVSHIHEYNYVVVNDEFQTAITELRIIIQAGRLSQPRQVIKHADLIKEFLGK